MHGKKNPHNASRLLPPLGRDYYSPKNSHSFWKMVAERHLAHFHWRILCLLLFLPWSWNLEMGWNGFPKTCFLYNGGPIFHFQWEASGSEGISIITNLHRSAIWLFEPSWLNLFQNDPPVPNVLYQPIPTQNQQQMSPQIKNHPKVNLTLPKKYSSQLHIQIWII